MVNISSLHVTTIGIDRDAPEDSFTEDGAGVISHQLTDRVLIHPSASAVKQSGQLLGDRADGKSCRPDIHECDP